MGPLVPEILSNEFNFVVAFLVGIAFGFILEQAGFSSTKKLVGLFYGYDFTVLKVFFTAGITAMIGVLVLSHFGLLDLDLVYVNPTFLTSAIVGGSIMGLGFIIGGFCPGTSLCGLAIGKIDAFWFVFGGTLGVFAFMEMYPVIEDLYKSNNWGNVRISSYFGLTNLSFAYILTFIAIAVFYFTQKIQDKLNKFKPKYTKQDLLMYGSFIVLPFFILTVLAVIPDRKSQILNNVQNKLATVTIKEMTIDKLAFELINNNLTIDIIDLRSPAEFKENAIPLSKNIPLDSMLNADWKKYFMQNHKKYIFYANNIEVAKKGYLLAKHFRQADDYVLVDNPIDFQNTIMNPVKPDSTASKNDFLTYEFRANAATTIRHLVDKMKNQGNSEKKKVKSVKGGCS